MDEQGSGDLTEDQEILMARKRALTETINVYKRQITWARYNSDLQRELLSAWRVETHYLGYKKRTRAEDQRLNELFAKGVHNGWYTLTRWTFHQTRINTLTDADVNKWLGEDPYKVNQHFLARLRNIRDTWNHLNYMDKVFGTKQGELSLFDRSLASLLLKRNVITRQLNDELSKPPKNFWSWAYRSEVAERRKKEERRLQYEIEGRHLDYTSWKETKYEGEKQYVAQTYPVQPNK